MRLPSMRSVSLSLFVAGKIGRSEMMIPRGEPAQSVRQTNLMAFCSESILHLHRQCWCAFHVPGHFVVSWVLQLPSPWDHHFAHHPYAHLLCPQSMLHNPLGIDLAWMDRVKLGIDLFTRGKLPIFPATSKDRLTDLMLGRRIWKR